MTENLRIGKRRVDESVSKGSDSRKESSGNENNTSNWNREVKQARKGSKSLSAYHPSLESLMRAHSEVFDLRPSLSHTGKILILGSLIKTAKLIF